MAGAIGVETIMNEKQIEVRAARTQEQVLNHQCDIVDTFDTIGEAKKRAKHYLTDEYQRLVEMSEPLGYAQVVVDGECLYDYFRKVKPVDKCPSCGKLVSARFPMHQCVTPFSHLTPEQA